jgi:hypothetical protein
VMEVKYDSMWGGWCSNMVSRSSGVGVWKFSRRGWWDFCRFVRFEVGDGSKIKFWQDVWCGD